MTAVLVAVGDLLMGSKVETTARQLGVSIIKVRERTPLADEVKRTGAHRIIVDLAAPGLGGPEAIRRLRLDPGLRHVEVLAYCRRSSVELMETAREVGCDRVLSVGEFSSQLPALLSPTPTSAAS